MLDAAALASTKLYTASPYLVRQSFIHQNGYLHYHAMPRRMHAHEADTARPLPAKGAQWVLRLLDRHGQRDFAAWAAWEAAPAKVLGHPKLPGYPDQQQGRPRLVYTLQARSAPARRQGLLGPSLGGIPSETEQQHVHPGRLMPRIGC